MHNGQDDFENQGDDEGSMDEVSYTNEPTTDRDQATSDHENEQSPSASDAASNHEMPEAQTCEEGNEEHHENTEALMGFFKLLPYLYLIQRNSNPSMTSNLGTGEPEPEVSSPDPSSMFDSQSLKSLLHLEAYRNQFQVNPLRYLQQFMPNSSVLQNGNGHEDSNSNENMRISDEDEMTPLDASSEHEEPLDLTQTNKEVVRTLVKARDDKLLRTNPRSERGYTIQDLEAALEDIKSGKLGTRRAAVIYGIPRSTLRNKVYKMGKSLPNKSPEGLYGSMEKPSDGDCDYGFMNESGSRMPYTDFRIHSNQRLRASHLNYEETDEPCDTNDFTSEGIQGRKLNLGPSSALPLRIDIGGGRKAESGDLHGERNQLVFTMDGRGMTGKGRHGSSSSLPLHNYPTPSTSYDGYNESSLGKKSRPKRGKYRNYLREDLAKAVQAVQNGQMSVHRAGSYFGVPHSTLEYKVKERHLLRQAKFKGKSTAKATMNTMNKSVDQTAGFSSVTSLSPSATLDSNDSTNFQKATISMGSDLQKSLSHYLNMSKLESRWSSPLGLSTDRAEENPSDSIEKEINDPLPLPKIYNSSSESLENNPQELLDLTKKT